MSNVTKKDYWIRTYSGKEFNFTDMQEDAITLEDIAHSLSLNCRFTGHVKEFYSVAEHCIWVSLLSYSYALKGIEGICDPVNSLQAARIALHGLLHDASEAYVTDLNSPAKQLLPSYKELEDKVSAVVYKKFGVFDVDDMPPQVKYADNSMLVAEAKALLNETDFSKWVRNNYDEDIKYIHLPMTPRQAEVGYLRRYETLTAKIREVSDGRS
jgi:hypothetical protein